jgi:hypothetical protein
MFGSVGSTNFLYPVRKNQGLRNDSWRVSINVDSEKSSSKIPHLE